MKSGTSTSDFGSSKRENHDSSRFYQSKLYLQIASNRESDNIENLFPKHLENSVQVGDSRNLEEIPDASIHLVITSPPYAIGKQYDENLTLTQYLDLIETVFQQIYPKLVDGGRVCINLANVGRKPYIPLTDYISLILTEIGFIQRGEVIWNKAASAGSSTAWGSWKSASNPTLRDIHEYLLIFSKNTLKRSKGEKITTILRDEFLEYTKSIWSFPTASARKIGHPAPYPVELPYRCIQLYSYEKEMIFDPFMGSGTTAIAAMKSNRRYFGLDIKQDYVDLANERIEAIGLEKKYSKLLKKKQKKNS